MSWSSLSEGSFSLALVLPQFRDWDVLSQQCPYKKNASALSERQALKSG